MQISPWKHSGDNFIKNSPLRDTQAHSNPMQTWKIMDFSFETPYLKYSNITDYYSIFFSSYSLFVIRCLFFGIQDTLFNSIF